MKTINKLQNILGGKIDKFDDNSSMWLCVENKDFSLEITFDGKGQKVENIGVFKNKKKVEIVPELITEFKIK